MDDIAPDPRPYGRIKIIGWIISIIGMVLWLYGYMYDGSPGLVDWPQYLPDWAAEFVPNLEAEIGFAISLVGMVPLYYVAFKEMKAA
ncbi:MAG: hypothetical protein HOK21_05625 [Rhodospirillaceae bacterium]|jgi:hypothetical protein|nr:hypothetical protein [Rhodospirillaceae bacterium]MBT3768110.1 hypothetical protein [Rhodospirillales bacterium]MBT4689103.1 hypothetical protein [Rhodospirillaceae bacterium]MBT5082072.1 hypothetical protein [Rhodospirillaceae bacterium]MBT5523545.1 hypothetical protein [Rhodospirillaceae bacterium]